MTCSADLSTMHIAQRAFKSSHTVQRGSKHAWSPSIAAESCPAGCKGCESQGTKEVSDVGSPLRQQRAPLKGTNAWPPPSPSQRGLQKPANASPKTGAKQGLHSQSQNKAPVSSNVFVPNVLWELRVNPTEVHQRLRCALDVPDAGLELKVESAKVQCVTHYPRHILFGAYDQVRIGVTAKLQF